GGERGNVVERAMVLADGALLDVAQLPRGLGSAEGAPQDPRTVAASEGEAVLVVNGDLSVKRQTAALERMLIERALARTAGNRTRAAQLLDLSPRALLYKIREYGLGE